LLEFLVVQRCRKIAVLKPFVKHVNHHSTCLHGLAQPYLANELQPVSTDTRRRLRSATTNGLVVPPTRLSTVGDRAFPVAAARVWNSLPVSVTSEATPNTFKQRLKTELHIRCYDLPSSYARKHSV